ncbi:MAG: YfhO family protein [Bacteroidetes bacterium]|nr:YfhO family protein [Bacteroidota bacterium]
MKNINWKKVLPHIAAIIIFLVVAIVYCKPALQGKVVAQHDIQSWRGMSQQSVEFNEKNGHYPLWTNSMFSGMPAYQIFLDSRTKISVGYFQSIVTLGLPKPMNFFFLACICFYFLCVVAGGNPWLGIMGGLAYAYSTFDPIIISAGHDTQMMSLGYAPAVIAGVLLLFQKRYWVGFAITSLFSALLNMQNHVQIVYYTLIIALIMVIAFAIKSYKEKQLASAIKSAALALAAGVIGLACCAVTMMPTYEYAKESMRGGRSELTLGDKNVKTKGGLNKDYAFNYSLGIGETMTFLVPGLYGGSNGGNEYNSNSKFVEKFSELGVPEDQALQYANGSSYWGAQPFTGGPVYLGAIICLLFIFAMVYLNSWYKWWLLAASAVGIILAWGANLKGINYFLFDYLPFYNKFRATTMALVIPQFCLPLAGVLAVSKLIKEGFNKEEILKKLKLTGVISGVILLLLAAFYFNASFSSKADKGFKENIQQNILHQVPAGQPVPPQMQQQAEQTSSGIINALQSDRKSLMGSDLLRSTILMALAFILLFLFVNKKITAPILVAGLILFSGYDLLGIANRYLNSDKYVDANDYESAFIPTEADLQILKDPDHANFRVFNQTVDVFNDASTSFHHNSVGGYHPAKLDLYNDLITYQLSKGNMQVFNMLNTKYFITQNPQTGKPMAQLNPNAYGNVWLAKGIKYVNNADQEMLALDKTDLKDTAVIENKFKAQIIQAPVSDSTASIKLISNLNDQINYLYESKTPQVAVFSEIYYPFGWDVYVDGKKDNYFKTDYVLRGMYLPAGKHSIEFKFEPKSYTIGRMISIIASLLVFLIILLAVFFKVKNRESGTISAAATVNTSL